MNDFEFLNYEDVEYLYEEFSPCEEEENHETPQFDGQEKESNDSNGSFLPQLEDCDQGGTSATQNDSAGAVLPLNQSCNDETNLFLLKKKRVREPWNKTLDFPSKDEAMSYIEGEKTWSCYDTKRQKDGKSFYFRCNKTKRRASQPCPSKLRLFFNYEEDKYHLYANEKEHLHIQECLASIKISEQAKDIVKSCLKDKKTMTHIIEAIHEKGIEMPGTHKLKNEIAKERKNMYGETKVTINSLLNFGKVNSNIPGGEHEAFVLRQESFCEKDKTYVRIFITTKHLLQNGVFLNKHVCVDSTYKLMYQRYPLAVIGSTDINKHFHFFGVAVISHEEAADYAFVFNTVKEGLLDIFQFVYNPELLMSDAAWAIKNGFQLVFGSKSLLTCYMHVSKAVKTWLEKKLGKSNLLVQQILEDLTTLYEAPSTHAFETMRELFKRKWYAQIPDFEKYFDTEWIEHHPNWNLSFALRVPSTNNAIEGSNSSIKSNNTFRERKSILEFLNNLLGYVKVWSINDSSNDSKQITDMPTIPQKYKEEAYQWSRSRDREQIRKKKMYGKTIFQSGEENWFENIREFRKLREHRLRNFTVTVFGKYIFE